jgi:hypothetical protein
MGLNNQHFVRFAVPPLDKKTLAQFESLAFDPYTGGKQRYRRFSQFRIDYVAGAWKLELLPPRPFVQAAGYNKIVGGVARQFEPIQFDPSPQVGAGADAGGLDRSRPYQINVHQVRVIVRSDITGITVPEGPHRDGHDFVMNVIVARRNVSGGISQLVPTGGGTPFFEDLIQENEAIMFDDRQIWHNATNILPLDNSGGHRDILIISFNDWERRRYGEEFEKGRGALALDKVS